MTHVHWVEPGFQIAQAGRRDVRLGVVLTLPFRLRLGRLYGHAFRFDAHEVDLWFHNPTDVPVAPFSTKPPSFPPIGAQLETNALIAADMSGQEQEGLQAIRAWAGSDGPPFPRVKREWGLLLRALNAFVVAYSMATGEMASVRALDLLSIHQMLAQQPREFTVVLRARQRIPESVARQLLSSSADPRAEIGQIGGLHDLPQEQIDSIPACLEREATCVFYEFAFAAKAKMVQGDYRNALLLAVAALEGAHAVFIANEFSRRFADDSQRKAEDYVRRQGMTACNETTPFLFMDETDRPASELIDACSRGLKYRNEIMHALRTKSGSPRIRERTNKEISSAYSGVLRVYECYRVAIERR